MNHGIFELMQAGCTVSLYDIAGVPWVHIRYHAHVLVNRAMNNDLAKSRPGTQRGLTRRILEAQVRLEKVQRGEVMP